MKFNTQKSNYLLFSLLLLGITCEAQRYQKPLTPEQSLAKLSIVDGLKVQLFAAEPYVLDPVALEFDEQGNAFVVEMPDYPFEVEPGKGKGRIRLLKDTNGDGRVDKSIIFAENITEGTSILPWKGGLIVTAAPNILYLKDTNGDGKADKKEVLFSGFFELNSEAQITSLRLGIDNWIYANNCGQSGLVTFNKKPGTPPIQVRGADFRFRLDKNLFELETGPGQFGQTVDDFGHRFFTANSLHLQQAVIPWRYTHRHSYLPSSKAITSITDHQEIMFQETDAPYWRVERTKQRNQMYKENNMSRVEYVKDHFTGASGGTVYTGDGLPKEYHGNIFTSDVSGNLVHRDIISSSQESPVMVAKRGEKEKSREFLFSTDTWFRPITFTTGPDGYLYVLDYYRQHIETPVSIPDELKKDMDFMAGSDKGRIYRVLPTGSCPKKISVNLRDATGLKLVKLLENPNGWWSSQAHRLLVERQDKSVIPALKDLFAKSSDAHTRLHALYVLEGLDALNAEIVNQALADPSAGVRENAIILAERFPSCLPKVIEKVNDESNRVVFQASLSLGEFTGKGTVTALATILEKYGKDSWFKTGILSSDLGSSPTLLQELGKRAFFDKDELWKHSFIEDLSYCIGARNNKEQVLTYYDVASQVLGTNDAFQADVVKGFVKGLDKSKDITDEEKTILSTIKTDSPSDIQEAIEILKKLH